MLHSLARRVNKISRVNVGTTPPLTPPRRGVSASQNVDRVEILDDGKLRVTESLLPLLRANGLDRFDKIMALTGGTMMRSVPGRSTVKIELRQPDGGTQVAFLKRYEPEYLSSGKKLLRFLRWPGADDEALHEWNSIRTLRACGFNAATPIAVGQERPAGIVRRSLLLTAEIAGGVAAHNYARTLESKARRELALQIADLTRQFHGAGFAHKDHYLSHIFVVPSESPAAAPNFYYIDLQRLIRPRVLRRRWIIKDLAVLGYSAQLSGATHVDVMRFCRSYFQKRRLSADDRRLIRSVMSRVNALHQRTPKYDVIWDQPGVHPPNV